MMKSVPLGLATAITVILMAAPTGATERPARQILLAQAETSTLAPLDPIAQAEQEVEEARAALRAAMAGSGNVREARRALRRALERLELARENPDEPLPPLDGEEKAAGRDDDDYEDDSDEDDDDEDEDRRRLASQPAPEESVEIQVEDGRVIVRQGGRLTIRHDDSARLEQGGGRRQVETGSDGTTTTTVIRPDGTRVVTVRDADGNILERNRRRPDGQVEILIGAAPSGDQPPPRAPDRPVLQLHRILPQLVVPIPQHDYIVESESASQRQLEQALIAPPVERVERSYSLREIRESGRLRNKLRRIDIDTVTFEFGSAAVPPDQIPRMERIGVALGAVLSRDPDEVFLIEGHTDAVGSDLANLALSDRRAESVAQILTFYFSIPPENLITQGYGEHFLKILTAHAERENRRVTLRRITPLLRAEVR